MADIPNIVEVKVKKQNVFTKIKNWWKYTLTEDDRDFIKIAGIWCVDGALWGSIITAGVCKAKSQKATDVAAAAGYISGKMDAYKEMAQNSYPAPVPNPIIPTFDKNNKVKKF